MAALVVWSVPMHWLNGGGLVSFWVWTTEMRLVLREELDASSPAPG